MREYLIDKKLLKHNLQNGLTYYIYPNNNPVGYVTFNLAIKIGSAVETEEQCGIAHFIEHMCLLNYTEYYSSDDETYNVIKPNGYTNFDETIFKLDCPSTEKNIEKCILIFNEILQGKAINKELIEDVRKGIINEWYNTEGKTEFIKKKNIFPLILNESDYSKRIPIGKIEMVTKFSYEDLIGFHRSWYRPELMAIIVCGDIDVLKMEAIINKSFEILPNNEIHYRVYQKISDYQSKRYTLNTYDKLDCAEVQIYYMQERYCENTISGFKQKIVENTTNYLIEGRIINAVKKTGLPLINLICIKNRFLRKYAFSVLDLKIRNDIQDMLVVVFKELQRIDSEGFSVDEFLYCKELFVQSIKSNYTNNHILRTENLAKECINEFLYDEPVLSLEDEYNLSLRVINEMTILNVDSYIKGLLSSCNTAIAVNVENNYSNTLNNSKLINCLNSFGYR